MSRTPSKSNSLSSNNTTLSRKSSKSSKKTRRDEILLSPTESQMADTIMTASSSEILAASGMLAASGADVNSDLLKKREEERKRVAAEKNKRLAEAAALKRRLEKEAADEEARAAREKAEKKDRSPGTKRREALENLRKKVQFGSDEGIRKLERLPTYPELAPQIAQLIDQKKNVKLPNAKLPKGSEKESAKEYVERHKIKEMFDMFLSALLKTKPDQPVDFLHEMAREMNKLRLTDLMAEDKTVPCPCNQK